MENDTGEGRCFDFHNRLRAGFALLGLLAFQVAGATAAFLDFIGLLAHGGLLPLYRILSTVYFRDYETGGRLDQYFFTAIGVSHWMQHLGLEFGAEDSDGIFCRAGTEPGRAGGGNENSQVAAANCPCSFLAGVGIGRECA